MLPRPLVSRKVHQGDRAILPRLHSSGETQTPNFRQSGHSFSRLLLSVRAALVRDWNLSRSAFHCGVQQIVTPSPEIWLLLRAVAPCHRVHARRIGREKIPLPHDLSRLPVLVSAVLEFAHLGVRSLRRVLQGRFQRLARLELVAKFRKVLLPVSPNSIG
jgi:hypothetical protein